MPAPLGNQNAVGNNGGRPRLYSDEDIERFAKELLVWMENESHFWLKDFCIERGIDPDFMAEWARENIEFNGAYKLAKAMQESRIFKGAMIDSYNVTMSKFALINNHGWADKTEAKISGDVVNPLALILQSVDGTSKELVNDCESERH